MTRQTVPQSPIPIVLTDNATPEFMVAARRVAATLLANGPTPAQRFDEIAERLAADPGTDRAAVAANACRIVELARPAAQAKQLPSQYIEPLAILRAEQLSQGITPAQRHEMLQQGFATLRAELREHAIPIQRPD